MPYTIPGYLPASLTQQRELTIMHIEVNILQLLCDNYFGSISFTWTSTWKEEWKELFAPKDYERMVAFKEKAGFVR